MDLLLKQMQHLWPVLASVRALIEAFIADLPKVSYFGYSLLTTLNALHNVRTVCVRLLGRAIRPRLRAGSALT